ncbi:alpha/beta fold hydrolase [Fibrella aquatica]|uniref:alpha/beta fold hydrolase n=1 Tax=Fibrella aquatica TaxID=3242487 RepID=UPI00352140E1
MKLYYREVGDLTATPLIIVHGIFGSSDNWLTISKTIADLGYRVILPDQRNHGQSPRSDDFSYVDMAADIYELITDLKLEKPILVGHSMGGKTMMQYVFTYPGTFSHLVIVDIAPKFYPVHHSEILRGLAAINLNNVRTRAEADAALTPFEPSPTVRQFLLKNLYRETIDGTAQFAWRLNLPVISREIHGVGEELTNPHPVADPTLFIRGRRSPYILDSDWPAILALFPNAHLATIEDAGHWVQAEKPAEFVEVLMGFLN